MIPTSELTRALQIGDGTEGLNRFRVDAFLLPSVGLGDEDVRGFTVVSIRPEVASQIVPEVLAGIGLGRIQANLVGNLFVIGSIRKAQLWESTAVPELRKRAAELANTLLESIRIAQASFAGGGGGFET